MLPALTLRSVRSTAVEVPWTVPARIRR